MLSLWRVNLDPNCYRNGVLHRHSASWEFFRPPGSASASLKSWWSSSDSHLPGPATQLGMDILKNGAKVCKSDLWIFVKCHFTWISCIFQLVWRFVPSFQPSQHCNQDFFQISVQRQAANAAAQTSEWKWIQVYQWKFLSIQMVMVFLYQACLVF